MSKLTIRGIVEKTFYASPAFSTGLFAVEEGDTISFRGKFYAQAGDALALCGKWVDDSRYGRQFDVETISYDLPQTEEGLVRLLAQHPDFVGIGKSRAEKIVAAAQTHDRLEDYLLHNITGLHEACGVPLKTLTTLAKAWQSNQQEIKIRAYLASFGLTNHQMNTLLLKFGDSVVSILKNDPYEIIKHISGYGFKKIDMIALKMGIQKEHPGRIEAGILYCLREVITSGHTWVNGGELLRAANTLLILDGLDSRERIQDAAMKLLADDRLVADGTAISTPALFGHERYIWNTFLQAENHEAQLPADSFLNSEGLNEIQKEAYESALTHRVSVISGGAGTGKTYVLARLAQTLKQTKKTIRLCAPTGKAAKRIEQLLAEYNLTFEAQTIHRLLGYTAGGSFSVDEVDADTILVDEASMVDVPLMAELLRRINFTRSSLILVGDHNQLPPVGAGNVLRDILQHHLVPSVILQDVVRQAGVLKRNSTAVLTGKLPGTAPGDPAWIVVDAFTEPESIQRYLVELLKDKIPKRLGYDPLHDVQIITPQHKGALGTKAINKLVQYILHGEEKKSFAVGDKVIQTANNYELGIMNGTIGFVKHIHKQEIVVDFEGEGEIAIPADRQGSLQLAFAITAHKAQGSEFSCVVLLCHKSHYYADRNWLYTGVTRAAKTCIILGDRSGLKKIADKNEVPNRRTFLKRFSLQEESKREPVPITTEENEPCG